MPRTIFGWLGICCSSIGPIGSANGSGGAIEICGKSGNAGNGNLVSGLGGAGVTEIAIRMG